MNIKKIILVILTFNFIALYAEGLDTYNYFYIVNNTGVEI